MKSQLILYVLVSASVLLASCGKSNSTGPDPDPDPNPNPNVVSENIGPDGGEITSADGLLTLTIPAGALGNAETITITPLEADDLGSEFDEIEVEKAYELGPDGLEFDMPITATFLTEQNPIAGPDSVEFVTEFLLTSVNGQVNELDSLQIVADLDNSAVSISGVLTHFSPLVRTLHQYKTGATGKFIFSGLPLEVFASPDTITAILTAKANLEPVNEEPFDLTFVTINQKTSNPLEAISPGEGLTGLPVSDFFQTELSYRCPQVGTGFLSIILEFGDENVSPSRTLTGHVLTLISCIEPTQSTFRLEVAVQGDGTGTVSSNPTGIDCPDDCDEDYEEETGVTLTATPDDGSVFTGWSGDIGIGDNNADSESIQITMDQNLSVAATFAKDQTTGNVGMYPSGTSFPRENISVPNPWGQLNFNSNCPNIWLIAGSDLGIVDPCSGLELAVLDIPISLGLNGGIALEPVEDANGNIENKLLLTSQRGFNIATLVNNESNDVEISDFTSGGNGFILAAGPNIAGGTKNALIIGRNVQSLSYDLNIPGGYPDLGENLLYAIDENGNPGNFFETPVQAYTTFENGTPQDIVGTAQFSENGSLGIRAFYAMRTMNGSYDNIIFGEPMSGESNDFTCEGNPNPNPPSNEAKTICFSVDRTSDGLRPIAIFNDENNPIQVLPLISTTQSPVTVDSRLTSSGNIDVISASFFGGGFYRGKFDFSGKLIEWGTGSYSTEIDGVEHISFDPFDMSRAYILGRNSNNIGVSNLPTLQPTGN